MAEKMAGSRKAMAQCCLFALAVLVAGGGTALAAAKKKVKTPQWSFSVRAEGEVRYDDNILGLSDTEKDLVDPSAPDNVDRFGVESPGDLIFSPLVGFGLSHKPRRGFETDIGLSVGSNQYLRNTVKDYHEYSLWVRQELNRSRKHRTALTVGGSRIPSYYLRQLVDDDESAAAGATIHNSAEFGLNRGYVEVSQEIVNRYLSVEGRYARERRNYNRHFNERDSSSEVTSLQVNIFPAGGIGFRIRPWYEHERRESRGDLASSTIIDDEVGFNSNLYGIELRGLWGRDKDHRNTVRGYYQREARDFGSRNAADLSHFDREDRITKVGAGYSRDLGARWKLGLSAYHRNNDVSISTSKFRRNVVAFSAGWSFDRRFKGPEGDQREEP